MDNAVKESAAPPAGEQELGDGTVQCTLHRFKNGSPGNPGGICAFCLQEQLGKLVSSSFPPQPIPIPSSSSSPSPSFRSDVNGVYGGFGASSVASSSSSSAGKRPEVCSGGQRSRTRMIPFVSAGLAKKKKSPSGVPSSFTRSKSTTSAAPRNGTLLGSHQVEDSPRSRRVGFWSSIFYYSSSSSKPVCSEKTDRGSTGGMAIAQTAIVEEDGAVSQRKVSRSRSVGCGSRSFSGDFFERISNGLGDCTLRRVESNREGNNGKTSRSAGRRQREARKQEPIKERVKCGGIFSGFMLTTSSSSSSSSSSYWVCDEASAVANSMRLGGGVHGKTRVASSSHSSWAWVFPSPMRAFSRPSSKISDKSNRSKKKGLNAPNLNAVPSILSVSG